MKHAKGRFCVGFWRAFCFCGDESVPMERAACIRRMQFEKGLGSSQQAFLRVAGRHDAKIVIWYQVTLLAHSNLIPCLIDAGKDAVLS